MILIALLTIWFLAVIYFVSHLSSTPTVHKPPALFQNSGHSYSDLENVKDRPSVPIITHDDNPKTKPDKSVDTGNIVTTNNHAQQMAELTRKLKAQSDLPREKRRIWSDIELPEIPFKQPRSVHDKVKEQFKNARWKPKAEQTTAKPTKSPTPSPVTEERS